MFPPSPFEHYTGRVNFLAHLHLAEPTAAGWIGSLAPDLLRGPALRACDPALRPAIDQHRRVDRFTDTHPLFARTRARLAPAHGRFAGILVDIFYDHVLARDWPAYDDRPCDAFINEVHAAFADHTNLVPPAMRPIVERMRQQRWLECYATVEGIASVLARMERRFSERFARRVQLACATRELVNQRHLVTADFAAFYPQLRARCGGSQPAAAAGR